MATQWFNGLIRHWWKFGLLIVVLASLPWVVGIVQTIERQHRFGALLNELNSSLEAMKIQCPEEVSQTHWDDAVDWTRNLPIQVFIYPHEERISCLKELNRQLAVRISEPVDFTTLQWVWDQIERCEATRPNRGYSLRFRDLRRLAKGPITDKSLPNLWSLDRVESLNLYGTQISDASLPTLSKLTHLRYLNVGRTALTSNAVAKLRGELPNCQIE